VKSAKDVHFKGFDITVTTMTVPEVTTMTVPDTSLCRLTLSRSS